MRRFLPALLVIAACSSGSFPSIDLVTGLTVLAIQAEPPDQLLVVDGGFFALIPDAGADGGAVVPIAAITAAALVADPGGNGRAIQAVFSTCARLDATTHQCLPSSPDYAVIGSGAYFPDAGPAITATATFTPDQQLLGDALALDPLHGFGYLPLPIQITVNAGTDQVIGVKTLTFSQPITLYVGELGSPNADAGVAVIQPADANPVNPSVNLNGAPWLPNDLGGLQTIGDGATVDPTLAPSGVPYFVPAFDGGLIPFTDLFSYEFYCTVGSFKSPRSGGGPRPGGSFSFGRGDAGANPVNDAGETIPGTSDQWTSDPGTPSQLVYFWIVALDGRGGVSFGQRSAQFVGP